MILWFRNDLRVHDNEALEQALNHGVSEAIYLATPKQWLEHHQAPIQIDFILRHLTLLEKQLNDLGVQLNIIDVQDFDGQQEFIKKHFINADTSANTSIKTNTRIFANYEVELNERQRDQQLIELGCNLSLYNSDVIVPFGKVLNLNEEMYKVFTPFKKAWLKQVNRQGFNYINRYVTDQSKPANKTLANNNDIISALATQYGTTSSAAWPLVEQLEYSVIPEFLSDKVAEYHKFRDIPSVKGTSGFSPYLAIGALSPRYLLVLLQQRFPDILFSSDSPSFSWLNELIWREFYRHLIFHFPNLCKGENFNNKYNNLPWQNNQVWFKAWCEGQTGYPIVDAAMKQLNATGWMHNRLRMIVASFLAKHLLIDWRWGEQYFREHLIDGDFAANNGGWQWSAGTGCDAQPYFRVFNPITQSTRFDPNGDFIRKYIPELEEIPDKEIHFPHKYIKQNNLNCYWSPLVEHKTARLDALSFYKSNI
ncbi:deoxyribodipyrimidine photo-lyase [Thalassotalea crassostreae]|uniref:deoxyribodipyrimidine photo-lyase n=1 Tax=Thalassotalea crassostreae TaxID=1763536 RepID=UPI0008396C38